MYITRRLLSSGQHHGLGIDRFACAVGSFDAQIDDLFLCHRQGVCQFITSAVSEDPGRPDDFYKGFFVGFYHEVFPVKSDFFKGQSGIEQTPVKGSGAVGLDGRAHV